MPTETVEQIEIDAYIDGELDLRGRFAVEDHLARHPTLAAQVMANMRFRSALQLMAEAEPAMSRSLSETLTGIQTTSRSIWRRPVMGMAAILVVGLMTMTRLETTAADDPPTYVDTAVTSHRSVMQRMVNTLARPISARDQTLLSASRLAIPPLPRSWRVTEVQLVKSKSGPAMVLAVRTVNGQDLSIFAIRERSTAPQRPDTVRDGRQSVAYWSDGDISYALTSDGNPKQLDATAEALNDLWRT